MTKEIIDLLEDIVKNRIFHYDSMDQNTTLEYKVEQMIEKLKLEKLEMEWKNPGYNLGGGNRQ